jgi:hypothetical protein
VHVDVDKAGREVEAADVGDAFGFRGGDVRGDFGDFAIRDGEIAGGAQIVLRVNEVASLEQQVIELGRERDGEREAKK